MNAAVEMGLNFLVNAAWQLIAIAIVALVADRLLRHVARARHFVWVGALLLSLGLPLWSATATLTRTNYSSAALPVAVAVPIAAPTNIETTFTPDSWSLSTIHTSQRVALLVSILFVMAMVFRGVRMGRAWLNTRSIRRNAAAVELRDELRNVVRECESAFGIDGCDLLSSATLRTPATVGALKPVLILPEQLIREADRSALTAAVGHELAHIRRRDYLFNLIYELIFLPLSVHPAAHFIKQRVTQTRELRCDELVAQRLLQPEVYAKSLLRLASWAVPLNQRTQSIIVGMADADILEVRIMSLLKKTRASVLSTVLLAIAAMVLLAIPCVAAAAFVFHFNIDTALAQEPSRTEQEKQEVRERREKEIKAKMEHQAQELTTAIQNETNAEVKAKLQRRLDELKEQMSKPIAVAITSEGDKYLFLGNNEARQREEREVEAKQKATLAQMAKISMDQAIQIAISKTPGTVLECSLNGEHWEAPGKLAKDGQVFYHVVILAGDESNRVVNHVLVNAIDGSVIKSETEKRRRENEFNEFNYATEGNLPRKSIEGGVLNGKALSLPIPDYPVSARAARVDGKVDVRIMIDEGGNVIGAEAVSGDPLLRAAAVNAAREAKFAPTRLQGQPVRVSGMLTYNFAIR